MSRKTQITPFKVINAGSLALSSITGTESTVQQTDVVELLAVWSGGQATNGTLTVEATLDNITWFTLDFNATISLDGVSGNHQLIIQQVSFIKIRPIYTRTNVSASGTLDVTIFATTVGA